MIPKEIVEIWKEHAPWRSFEKIEQDLIISRALIELYNNPIIKSKLAFKGGTALNKLYFNPPARYSEDIDLVQIKSEPIGETLDAIRECLDHWLGKPKWKLTKYSAKFFYTFDSLEKNPIKLKIEINIAEHFQVNQLQFKPFEMKTEWFSGKAEIVTYELNELMGTKLKALYQRNKGRDLFDMWLVLTRKLIDVKEVIKIFDRYCRHNEQIVTRAMFEESIFKKLQNKEFTTDMSSLLAEEVNWNFEKGLQLVQEEIITKIPGNPWKCNAIKV